MLFGRKNGIKNRNRDRYERVRRLMWIKCESCGKLVYYRDYKDNHYVCPRCGRAFIMNPKQRFDLLFDDINSKSFETAIFREKFMQNFLS